MAYRIISTITKDDDKPWPWDRQNLPWLAETVDLFGRIKSVGETAPTPEQTVEWLRSGSTVNAIRKVKEFPTEELANKYMVTMYTMVENQRSTFQNWSDECGYENIQFHLDIEEI